MNKAKFTVFLTAVLVALGALVIRQYKVIQRLQAENLQATALRTETDRLRKENQYLSLNQTDARELEKLRREQSELLRLRDELSRLRRQLKETAAPKPASIQAPTNTTAPESQQPASPVNTYQATIRAALAPGQTLVTGGWATAEGKRTFVLIQPEVTDNNQITVQSRFVELPEETVPKTGLEALKSDGKQSTAQAVLSEEQTKGTLTFFEATQGVNVLATPKVSTLAGRQAQIKAVNLETIDGDTFEMGPTVDIVPYLSADQSTIDMTVIATLRTPATPPR